MSRENPLERQCDRQFAQQDDVNRLGRHCSRSASGDQLCCHWRPHIGANGVSWPPWKNGWKIKKAITCEKEHFSVLQNAPFRNQIFENFLRLRRQGGIDPLNQNSADVLVCCLMCPDARSLNTVYGPEIDQYLPQLAFGAALRRFTVPDGGTNWRHTLQSQ